MKKIFYGGFSAGFVLGIAVALSMDLLLGKTLGSGWSEAVANDLNRVFKSSYPTDHPLVIILSFGVIGIVGLMGGLMGGGFSYFIAKLFGTLQRHIPKK